MSSAGELLRSERVKRNRSLSEIATTTCISTRYLEAIEADDTKILPGDFFHRSFIRQYASALGLDNAETNRILSAVVPVPEIDPIPVLSLPRHIAEVEHRAKPLARVPARTAATLLVVVLAGCSGLYAIWNRAQEQSEARAEAQSEALAQAAARESLKTESPKTESPAAAQPATISVDVSATEPTWISLSSEGKTVFSGILDTSQTKNFALVENAKLLIRNPAGLDVRMNGRSLGPLGPRGETRVVLFSQDRFEIQSARGM